MYIKPRLSGFQVRKALEAEASLEEIFPVEKSSYGDVASKELYEDGITHTSELENADDLFFKTMGVCFYSEPKKVYNITDNLKAFVYNSYISITREVYKKDVENIIESNKSKEIIFLNTEILDYNNFCKNIMEAQMFLGKFEKTLMKRKFFGIGDFGIDFYALGHELINCSDLSMSDFYIRESNLVTTIDNMLNARYEKDVKEQKEYLDDVEYINLINTAKKHRHIIESEKNRLY
jgi:hypothetical protein